MTCIDLTWLFRILQQVKTLTVYKSPFWKGFLGDGASPQNVVQYGHYPQGQGYFDPNSTNLELRSLQGVSWTHTSPPYLTCTTATSLSRSSLLLPQEPWEQDLSSTLILTPLSPGALFLKVPKSFRIWKALAKSQTL